MEKKRLGIGWLIIAYALLAVVICFSVYVLAFKSDELQVGSIVIAAVETIAALAAINYFAKGYKKDAAKYFKISMLLFTSTFLLDYVFLTLFPVEADMGNLNISGIYLEIVLMLIEYGNFVLLSVAKDLGKKWSYLLLSVNLLINIFYLITTVLVIESNFVGIWFIADQCLMELVFFIMVKAKYIDKSNRAENLQSV